MSSNQRKGLETALGIVLVSASIIPLIQWILFDHESRIIRAVFQEPDRPWIWVWPSLIGIVCAVALIVVDQGKESDS